MGNVYPVIEDPFDEDPRKSLRGKPANLRYDAYFAAVEWTDRGPKPCRPQERADANLPVHSELVIHKDHAILPRFVMQLRRRASEQVSPQNTAAASDLAEAEAAEPNLPKKAKDNAEAAEALEASKMSAEL